MPSIRSAVATLALCLLLSPAQAAETPPPAKVMLIGVFHFENPGRDMVKSGVIDVMTPENQQYLEGFSARLAAFQPTDVLIECSPAAQAKYDERFRDYLAGTFAADSNENYQIGFRVAKAAGLKGVTCFDEDTIGWNAQPMFDYIEAHEPDTKRAMETLYQDLSAQSEREQSTLTLPQLLRLANDPAKDTFNKSLYVLTTDVEAGRSFAGADASASWWHRNFRMYANIQKAASPGHRVIAVAGQGHTAILRDLLSFDARREAESVATYLDP
jgi:hypothetical protein